MNSVDAAMAGFRRSAARGMRWMAIQTIATRVISISGQFILGWLLTPADFGLYALALSIANAMGALRNGGVNQLFLGSPDEFERLSAPLTRFALLFNVLVAVLLCTAAPLAGARFHSNTLVWLILAIGVSAPIGTLAIVYRSWLIVEHRYGESTTLSFVSTLFWQLGTIGLALVGLGPYSYALPTALQGVVETLCGYHLMRRWPVLSGRLDRHTFARILRSTRWVMLGALMLSLATTGDYLAVGWFAPASFLGQYFFAFQLVIAVGTLLSNGMETVLPPLLARLDFDRPRQGLAVLQLTRASMLVCWPVATLLSFGAPAAMHLLWGAKWTPAANVLPIMAYCLPAWILKSIARALLESRTLWRKRFWFLGVYGVGGITSAVLGAASGRLLWVAFAVTAFYISFAMCVVPLLARQTQQPVVHFLKACAGPVLISLFVAAALYLFGMSSITLMLSPPIARWLMAAACGALLLALHWLFLSSSWSKMLWLLKSRSLSERSLDSALPPV